jgi:hypothetical protein
MDPISIALGLAQFAPTILRYLGVGDKSVAVAEKVVETAQVITGAKNPADALEMIRNNQVMQMAFQEKIIEQDGQLEQAYLSDRANARARDIKFIEQGMPNARGNILAFVAIAALIGLIFALFFKQTEISSTVKDLLLMLAGALMAIVKDVYAFEFGSTRDSRNKTQMLAEQIRDK